MRAVSLFILIILFPALVQAATLVNINTASVVALDSIPYITPKIAQSIVDYRKENLFIVIEDIMKVTGIKEGIFGHIQSLITVGDTNTADTSGSVSDNTASSTIQDSSEDITVYTPPPSALTVDAGSQAQNATTEVPLLFSARVTTKNGAIDSSAQIVWGFGDGSSATASSVKKTYYYAGTYLVVVTATDGLATGRDEIIVTVRSAQVRILEIPDAGIMITNDASERLDLSGWALFSNKKSFRIPNGTVILPKASIILPPNITFLATTPEVTLAYPDGSIAAQYVQPSPVVEKIAQPPVPSTSSNEKKVEPITSQKISVQKNENAVSAPTAATELAAVGAALSPAPDSSKASPQTSAYSIFKSPWTLGFLGTMILAGGAFILL